MGPGAPDPEVLAAAFPGLRYVWLRRGDKLRRAISWWRAAATGQYALADGGQSAPPPPSDPDAIGRLLRYAEECEAGRRGWFTVHSIAPFEIVYEDMTGDLATLVGELAAYLDVVLPPGLPPACPRLRRQADVHTERLVELFTGPRGT